MLILLDSVVNIIGGPMWSFNEKENPHFDNDVDIHMTSENSEENGSGHDLDLLIIST